MKYNFKVQISFDTFNDVVAGLDTSSTLTSIVQVSTNTELPDELVESLRQKVSTALSAKIGTVDVQLVSAEH